RAGRPQLRAGWRDRARGAGLRHPRAGRRSEAAALPRALRATRGGGPDRAAAPRDRHIGEGRDVLGDRRARARRARRRPARPGDRVPRDLPVLLVVLLVLLRLEFVGVEAELLGLEDGHQEVLALRVVRLHELLVELVDELLQLVVGERDVEQERGVHLEAAVVEVDAADAAGAAVDREDLAGLGPEVALESRGFHVSTVPVARRSLSREGYGAGGETSFVALQRRAAAVAAVPSGRSIPCRSSSSSRPRSSRSRPCWAGASANRSRDG